ncbi:uncharacterized protein TM35_000181170 [Trypanosoma theileri]|uniref:C3H1-type domain-containing protein n=1 Tax=Trypanosoma theileri TaxID=67003 RepID=A0A1X0NVB9_9TRYP|nr:uncharacterized protein TM35_000181170 [Trypanosoma theileri]ORC88060.1 hypothetical protein TM35_000181170 [Trypanosoma theileri]
MARNRRRDIVKTSKYKTSICSFFVTAEGCPFGDRCAFAHGAGELRSEVENTRILEGGGSLESGTEEIASDPLVDGCRATTNVIPLSSKGEGVDSSINPESGCSLKDTVMHPCLGSTLCPESLKNTEMPVVTSRNKENPQNEPVSLVEGGSGKGSKPPPKVTKRVCMGQKRSIVKNSCNKIKTTDQNNNNRQVISNNQCCLNCGFKGIENIKNDLIKASHLHNCAVPLPYSTDGTHFGNSMGLHSGCLHPISLSQSLLQMAGNSVVAPFAATPVVNTEHMYPVSAHPFNDIPTSHIPYNKPNYSVDHSHYSSNQIFSTLMSHSISPMASNAPFSVGPLHNSSIWPNLQNNSVSLPVTRNPEVEGNTNCHFVHNHLQNVEAVYLTPAAKENDINEEHNGSQTSLEWDQVIRRWLDSQTEVLDNEFAEQESLKTTSGKYFTTGCMLSETEHDEGGLQAFDVLTFDKPSCESVDKGTTNELDRTSNEFEEATCAREEVSPVVFERNEGPLTASEACSANEKNQNVDESGEREEEGNLSSNTSKKNNSEVNNNMELETQESSSGCKHCMPLIFKRRRPVVVNHFRSSCVAARRMMSLYSEECRTLKSVDNDKEGTLYSNNTATPSEMEWSVEYCI